MRKQIERAEKALEKRDEQYRELEARFSELELGGRQRALMQEISDKNEQLSRLQHQLSELSDENEQSDISRRELEAHLDSERTQRDALRTQLADMEIGTPTPRSPNDLNTHSAEQRMSDVHEQAFMQDRYEAALSDLESVNSKYQKSLQQIQALSQQLDESKVEEIDSSVSSSPQSSLNGISVPRSQSNSMLSDSERPTLLANGQGAQASSRRSMPIGSISPSMRTTSFLGKGGPRPTQLHTHLRSVSLSRDSVSASNVTFRLILDSD